MAQQPQQPNMTDARYIGRPCKNCGTTVRLKANRSCVRCSLDRYSTHRIKVPWIFAFRGTRRRCKEFDILWDLDYAWAERNYTGYCALSGLPFNTDVKPKWPKIDTVSLDRINPEGGYLQGNCRFIWFGLNSLKGKCTDAEVKRVCTAVAYSLPSHRDNAIDYYIEQIKSELERATRLHGTFPSARHGHSVILEEYEEAWDAIKKNKLEAAKIEFVQTAAMILRFLVDIKE